MKKILKNILRFLNIIVIKPNDSELIEKLKETFTHNERSFVYSGIKRLVDCLYCHASPGVIETISIELSDILRAKKTSGNKILNMGGGTGQVSSIYKSLGFDVYNLDIDLPTSDSKNIKFDLNQTIPIPFPNKTFDVVICQEIIEHVENPWKMVREAKKLLKDDGILIITTPNIVSLQSRLMFFFRGYFKWFTPDCFDYHINPIPYWEINLIANRCGLNRLLTKGSGDYYMCRDNNKQEKLLRDNESLIFFFKRDDNN
ncbi:MAG: class I SAM-dependent methyltransferase [Candidatus Paceibacterota bacterium]|jgi:SAM-dependent methyltransferase